MLKRLLLITLILLCCIAKSQDTLITYGGREVVLLENHTWQYLYQPEEELLGLKTDTINRVRSDKATFKLQSKIAKDYCFYYNPDLWNLNIVPFNNENGLEYSISRGSLAVIDFNAYKETTSPLRWKQIIIDDIKYNLKTGVKLLEEEVRTVNGIKVLYFKTKFMMLKKKTFSYHYLIASSTSCIHLRSILYKENEKGFEQLILEAFSGIIECNNGEK